MRSFVALCVMCLCAADAFAAKPSAITTTDGKSYTLAADGSYYPAGSAVVGASAAAPCTYCTSCSCAAGVCPSCPVAQASPVFAAPVQNTSPVPAVYGACNGGSCSAPPARTPRLFAFPRK